MFSGSPSSPYNLVISELIIEPTVLLKLLIFLFNFIFSLLCNDSFNSSKILKSKALSNSWFCEDEANLVSLFIFSGNARTVTLPSYEGEMSVLKHSVPDFIQQNEDLSNLISKIETASLKDGGEGAFYIYLKK